MRLLWMEAFPCEGSDSLALAAAPALASPLLLLLLLMVLGLESAMPRLLRPMLLGLNMLMRQVLTWRRPLATEHTAPWEASTRLAQWVHERRTAHLFAELMG